ncbi:MAG: hypothetical protein GX279_09655 [Clostridiaceae bacterium]|nr:hypothetical protein [Clostridiaceae bacterium]
MIRSIFIGFLILSTLTAKGAGIQAAASTSGTASALKELIGAASAHAQKNAGPSCESSRISSCNGFKSVNSHLLPLNTGSSEVYITTPPLDADTCLMGFDGIYDCGVSRIDEGMYSCRSGLSPP